MAAFDATRGQTVALGFSTDGTSSETWLWDGTDWAKASDTHSPPPRDFGSMAYVPALGKVVLFGGKISHRGRGPMPSVSEEVANDLWTWDGTDWTQIR
jgi:hypothetical protein